MYPGMHTGTCIKTCIQAHASRHAYRHMCQGMHTGKFLDTHDSFVKASNQANSSFFCSKVTTVFESHVRPLESMESRVKSLLPRYSQKENEGLDACRLLIRLICSCNGLSTSRFRKFTSVAFPTSIALAFARCTSAGFWCALRLLPWMRYIDIHRWPFRCSHH